jgi:hypothetical protein
MGEPATVSPVNTGEAVLFVGNAVLGVTCITAKLFL